MATTMTTGRVPEWTLPDRLRKARETAGLKQTELADLTGISRGSIVNYESGKTAPRRPALAAWAMACGVPFEWLEGAISGGSAPTGGGGSTGPVASGDMNPRSFTTPRPLPRVA